MFIIFCDKNIFYRKKLIEKQFFDKISLASHIRTIIPELPMIVYQTLNMLDYKTYDELSYETKMKINQFFPFSKRNFLLCYYRKMIFR